MRTYTRMHMHTLTVRHMRALISAQRAAHVCAH